MLRLEPDEVRVTIDDEYRVGLLSIRWPGHGMLHLPAATQLDSVDSLVTNPADAAVDSRIGPLHNHPDRRAK